MGETHWSELNRILEAPGEYDKLRILTWLDKFLALNTNASVIIVGNKIDLVSSSEIDTLETSLQEMGQTFQCPTLLTSAKNGQNVEESFIRLAECMMD